MNLFNLWYQRITKFRWGYWRSGACIVIPYWKSYTDEDEDGVFERWEDIYVKLYRVSHEPLEPRIYFWRYDGRLRLVLRLPFRIYISCGFDYYDFIITPYGTKKTN